MFDIKDSAKDEKKVNGYLTEGIHDGLSVTEIELKDVGVEGRKAYIVIKARNSEGFVRSRKMYLTTVVNPGKKMSAWQYTARSIKDLIKASHNCTEEQADEMIGSIPSEAVLVEKLSSILIGKSFRAVVSGDERPNGTYYEFKGVESMSTPRDKTRLRLPSKTGISVSETNDLPF